MVTIKKDINEKLYQTALLRIDELLHEVTDETPVSDKRAIELSLMSDIVMAYEEKHFPIASSPLADVKIALEEKHISKSLGRTYWRISISDKRILKRES